MDIAPARFKMGQRCCFHNSILGNFMVIKTDLKQMYCTVVIRAPRKFRMIFIFEVRGQHLLWTEANILVTIFFCFLKINFHRHELLHCASWPTAVPVSLVKEGIFYVLRQKGDSAFPNFFCAQKIFF